MKLLPGIMVVGGLALFLEGGEGTFPGLIVAAIGAVWSYFWYIAPNLDKPKN